MSDARAWERLAAARVARFATSAPRVVPVTFAVVGESVVHAVDHKPKATRTLARLADLARDPRASVLVDHYDDADWSALWWARADGSARVLDAAPGAVELLAARYAPYRAEPPAGPFLEIRVARWSGWEAAG
jgi:PPOX class probable F420-dependent enzyme